VEPTFKYYKFTFLDRLDLYQRIRASWPGMQERHRKYSSNALDAAELEALNGFAYLSIALN
jgi:hypothetical protein